MNRIVEVQLAGASANGTIALAARVSDAGSLRLGAAIPPGIAGRERPDSGLVGVTRGGNHLEHDKHEQ